MRSIEFYVDFESDVPEFDDEFKTAAKMRLRSLAIPHHEIDHAKVAITKSGESGKPAQFQASVIVYARPEDMNVTKQDYRMVEALDEALAEIEHQIHAKY
ncbi:MAG: hypothetical protein ACM3XO_05025 [Bacteroidota bacterium]|jgi:ribosome-associated translation inhibitor RaiA